MSEQNLEKLFEEQNKKFEMVQQTSISNCYNQSNGLNQFLNCATPFINKFENMNKNIGLSMAWSQMNLQKCYSLGKNKDECINEVTEEIRNIFNEQFKDLE